MVISKKEKKKIAQEQLNRLTLELSKVNKRASQLKKLIKSVKKDL